MANKANSLSHTKWMCKYQKNNIQKCCMNFVKMSGIDITVYKYPPEGACGSGQICYTRIVFGQWCLSRQYGLSGIRRKSIGTINAVNGD